MLHKFQNTNKRFFNWFVPRFMVLLPALLILLATSVDAQQLKGKRGGKAKPAKETVTGSPKVRKAQKKKQKQDDKLKKEAEKARKKAHEDHLNKQSAEVRERMKESEKESSTYRKKTTTPFYKKWFRRKRK